MRVISCKFCFESVKMSLLVTIILWLIISTFSAQAQQLAPFKDAEFAYPGFIGPSADPLNLTIDYNEMRDINARDEVPEKHVKAPWLDLSVRRAEQDVGVEGEGGTMRTIATGAQDNATFIVVYLHGQGGNRKQGSNDLTFGGNFNRIRNLAALNGGLYLTPDFSDFGDKGGSQVKAIISAFLTKSPNAKLVVACGSMGGYLCHRLAKDANIGPRLSGMMFLGSFSDSDFTKSIAFKGGLPVFIGHGSEDKTSPIQGMADFAGTLRKSGGKGRVMFHRFETGTHGTPIRMFDWRLVLNWMFAKV